MMARVRLDGDELICEGDWRLPGLAKVESRLPDAHACPPALKLNALSVETMDLAGARVLRRWQETMEQQGRAVDLQLTPRQQRLFELVTPVEAQPVPSSWENPLAGLGRLTQYHGRELLESLAFVGEVSRTLLPRLLRPGLIRGRRFMVELEQAGINGLPIVGLLSFLVGIVIAYQLSSSLDAYGAGSVLPELLTSTILRELAPLVVAIVVAGRTASSYAAQLGTMQINEEIDALRTLGINPFDMMVLPKLLALILAVPLLTVMANLTGMLGGIVVNWLANDQGIVDFLLRLPEGMGQRHLWLGLIKAPVFGLVIGIIGCRQGMRVERGAEGVGRAATTAVVQAIFAVIVINAFFSVLFNILGL